MNYTEKDFQDYAEGEFNGNKEAFEKWLAGNFEARKVLQQYDNLFKGLKSQPEYQPSFSLEDKVMRKLQSRMVVKKRNVYFLNGALIVAIAVALFFCWRVADFSSIQSETGVFIGAAFLTLGFTAGLHLLELNRTREKFKTFV
jgi:hypothetical protein